MQCDRHYAFRRNSTVFGEYESIPKTLVLNLIAWPLLLLLFSILRKLAWDYGRIALVSRDEERWMSLFFGERSNTHRRRLSCSSSAESLDRKMKQQDKGFCSWIPAYFRLKDEHIRRKCGNDAVQYLQFQRYLISYAVLICLISIGVILPINFMGSEYEAGNFARTTISNIKAGDPQLWIHFLLAVVYLVMALVFMRHFSKNLQFYEDEQASRTLMVCGMPRHYSVHQLTSMIRKYFKQAYSRVAVSIGGGETERVKLVDVQYAFDIRRLLELDLRRTRAKLALLNLSLLMKRHIGITSDSHPLPQQSNNGSALHLQVVQTPQTHEPSGAPAPEISSDAEAATPCQSATNLKLHPYMCGQLICCNAMSRLPCCGCCAEVDAEPFYREEVERYTRACSAEQQRALERPCGIAFLTFETAHQARAVLVDFKRANMLGASTPRATTSSSVAELRVSHWSVSYSPEPNNLQWQNLAVPRVIWWLKAVVINMAVFAVVFLFTTPSLVVNELRRVDLDARLALAFERDVSFFTEFVHLLIIVLFSSLLPYFVFYTNQFVGNWTRSAAHLVVMYKSFILLVLMILVLPSIGFASALLFVLAFFRSLFVEKTTDTLNQSWRCIFEPSNGAFFVRYVITAGFIGTSLELLRFADLFVFTLRMLAARSAAERATIRKRATDEFEFGRNYAHQLCVFAVLVAYSIPVPLVTPFGVIYIALRYAVDRHNLYFALKPSRIDKHIHTSAINFFMSSLILLQLNVVFYLTTKSSTGTASSSSSASSTSASTSLFSSNGQSYAYESPPPEANRVIPSVDASDMSWQILQVAAIGTFLITLIVYCGCSMFDWFKNVSPIVYTTRRNQNGRHSTAYSDLVTPAHTAGECNLNGGTCCNSNADLNSANGNSNGMSLSFGRSVHARFADSEAQPQAQSSSAYSTDKLANASTTLLTNGNSNGNGNGNCHVVQREACETVTLRRSCIRRDTAFLPSVLLKCYEWPLFLGQQPEAATSTTQADVTNSQLPSPNENPSNETVPINNDGLAKVLVHSSAAASIAATEEEAVRNCTVLESSAADETDGVVPAEQGVEEGGEEDGDLYYPVEFVLRRASCVLGSSSSASQLRNCTFSRSRTVTGDSSTFYPEITITAPTPARLSSTSIIRRSIIEPQEASVEETVAEFTTSRSSVKTSSNGHQPQFAVDVDEAVDFDVRCKAETDSVTETVADAASAVPEVSTVQHSSAQHNWAFS